MSGLDGRMRMSDCVSDEEKKLRLGVTLVNGLGWMVALGLLAGMFLPVFTGALKGFVSTYGGILLTAGLVLWAARTLSGEYQVRRLQALGATVSADQFPQVHEAVEDVRRRFGLNLKLRVIVVDSGEANAFSVCFARKHAVVLLSKLLEGVVGHPAQLKALLAHEICHSVLDHGGRGLFEQYKSPQYKAARELTCDNAGLAASEDLEASKALVKKLCVGDGLHGQVSEPALVAEAEGLYSGFLGWVLKRNLTHPPAGKRLANLDNFSRRMAG